MKRIAIRTKKNAFKFQLVESAFSSFPKNFIYTRIIRSKAIISGRQKNVDKFKLLRFLQKKKRTKTYAMQISD